ncbi:MAG: DUF5996 family protein [Candidatus Korobacteraceae bacterium]|jgi:hypothetical protein
MINNPTTPAREDWPALPYEEWKDTCATLHMWTQIVGKVRMQLSPPVNHWWHVALYVDVRGLTTSPIPFGAHWFAIRFDFIDHRLVLETSSGDLRALPLKPQSVAEFYRDFTRLLEGAGIKVNIDPMPVEVPHPIPYNEDTVHASYDREYAQRFWRTLLAVAGVFQEFRGRFLGKCSPVHFFWGSFDLAVTRFSGRRAPERPGADHITREAYSCECSSAGWWPGGETLSGVFVPGAAFYSYMSPEPAGYSERRVRPEAARYDRNLGEFLLMYDEVRRAESPRIALLDFLQTTYAAGAELAHWDRAALEQPESWLRQAGPHAA